MRPDKAEHLVRLIQALAQEDLPDAMFARAVKKLVGAPQRDVGERKSQALVRVKARVEGGLTSVSVPSSTLALLAQRMGGMPQARQHVRELVQRAPAGTANRSRWVQDELAKKLAAG
jgi:hypothetical protein